MINGDIKHIIVPITWNKIYIIRPDSGTEIGGIKLTAIVKNTPINANIHVIHIPVLPPGIVNALCTSGFLYFKINSASIINM